MKLLNEKFDIYVDLAGYVRKWDGSVDSHGVPVFNMNKEELKKYKDGSAYLFEKEDAIESGFYQVSRDLTSEQLKAILKNNFRVY